MLKIIEIIISIIIVAVLVLFSICACILNSRYEDKENKK